MNPFPPALDLSMESLELVPLLLLLHPPPSQSFNNSRSIRQLRFPSLLNSKTRNANLRSFSGNLQGGGGATSQDGPFAFEDQVSHHKDDRALVLARETDDFGYLVGFRLLPNSGLEEFMNVSHSITEEDSSSDEVEKPKVEDTEEEEAKTRVSHNIVVVTSEAAPYSKTGGLADVCGSLPIALASRGHRVMVVTPRYIHGTSEDLKFAGAVDLDQSTKVFCFGGAQEIGFYHEYREGVDWVFVDHPSFHRPGNPYGDKFGTFGDNQFRFTLLCHAACEAPLVLPLGGFSYGEKCLFLANDWHASLVPMMSTSTLFVVQTFGSEVSSTWEWYGALEWVFPTWARTHALDTGEAVNFLKGAVVTADRIVTGYSWEITTSEGGCGLHDLLSSRKSILSGITNGIDVTEWDPSCDKHIACNYSADDLSGKAECKISLQKELGLPMRPDCPMVSLLSAMQNSCSLFLVLTVAETYRLDSLEDWTTRKVMLGSGNPIYEDWMRATESIYKDKFRGWVGFNVPISHKITAGCDILLMPSAFEPCGLNQLYAMRYGTIPVVHETGGLRDTVHNFNPYAEESRAESTGWTFSPLTKESMLAALRYAIQTYNEYKSSWEGLMIRGMTRDYTWVNAATQYEQVIEWAFTDPPYC
ncbi:hypothetical protein JHK85_011455 [Glycine max]|nr:hypothetical protein JHK85_011455 [Glycine max]